jgi:hypothetical protein
VLCASIVRAPRFHRLCSALRCAVLRTLLCRAPHETLGPGSRAGIDVVHLGRRLGPRLPGMTLWARHGRATHSASSSDLVRGPIARRALRSVGCCLRCGRDRSPASGLVGPWVLGTSPRMTPVGGRGGATCTAAPFSPFLQWGEGHAGGVSSTRHEGQRLARSLPLPLTPCREAWLRRSSFLSILTPSSPS